MLKGRIKGQDYLNNLRDGTRQHCQWQSQDIEQGERYECLLCI